MAKEEPKLKVRVSATPERGFRRLGRQFTREAQDIDVTASELNVLKTEKNLVVVEMSAAKPKDPEGNEGKK